MKNRENNGQQANASDDILYFDVAGIASDLKYTFFCFLDWLIIPFLPQTAQWERNVADTWFFAVFVGALFCGALAEKLNKHFWLWCVLALIPFVKVAVYAFLIFRAIRVLIARRDG